MAIRSFQDLRVWQYALALAEQYYQDTHSWRDYSLRDQVRRAAVSVPANIAEGAGRQQLPEFRYFLRIARGSCTELVTLTLLAERVHYLAPEQAQALIQSGERVVKMLTVLSQKLQSPHS